MSPEGWVVIGTVGTLFALVKGYLYYLREAEDLEALLEVRKILGVE